MTTWITRDEATEILGIRAQTLYAYVSRKLIEVSPDPTHPRRNLYRAEDVAALQNRRDLGRARQTIAASTMAWGEPIIETRISTIRHGRLYYRGRDAIHLSLDATLEEAAGLLWDGENIPAFPRLAASQTSESRQARAYAALGQAAARGVPAHKVSVVAMRREAASIVGVLASALVDLEPGEGPLHTAIAAAWGCPEKAELLRRTLVQLADQELTSSAFAARVTASTGASLGACALAGLAVLSGPLHGDATVRVQALLDDARRLGVEAAVRRWMGNAAPLPGFGHKLYPDGDPRAEDLLRIFEPSANVCSLIAHVRELTGLEPTIDVALAALAEHCRLPEGAAFALFAIGRSVGWMAHSIEQITTGSLLRPRATYIGPPISDAEAHA